MIATKYENKRTSDGSSMNGEQSHVQKMNSAATSACTPGITEKWSVLEAECSSIIAYPAHGPELEGSFCNMFKAE